MTLLLSLTLSGRAGLWTLWRSIKITICFSAESLENCRDNHLPVCYRRPAALSATGRARPRGSALTLYMPAARTLDGSACRRTVSRCPHHEPDVLQENAWINFTANTMRRSVQQRHAKQLAWFLPVVRYRWQKDQRIDTQATGGLETARTGCHSISYY
jgi:hypothetical protein